MKKRFTNKVIGVFLVATLIIVSTATLGVAMAAAQATADKEIVEKSINEWVAESADYEIPIADGIPGLYIGERTTDLMPIDLTFTKSDVPKLIDNLKASKYGAVYLDNEICLRITKDGSIQVSKDNGATWEEYDANDVDAKDFAVWLLKNDPIPGYSMKEMQTRLESGATVKHIVFENGKEMYFVIDADSIQIELVQSEKFASVLIDGQRMMITSVRVNPYLISSNMLQSFYDLIVSFDIMAETEAEQDYAARIAWIENADAFVINENGTMPTIK